MELAKINEIWKDIENYEGYYQISSLGRVRGVDRYIIRKDGKMQHYKSTVLKPFQGKTCNYLSVQLSKDNIAQKFMIHRLVAYAFLNLDKNSDLEVNHKDGNRHNNNVGNLEVVTHQENIDHSIANNLKNDYGEKSTNAKLTNLQVAEIRRLWLNGVKQIDLAYKYGISKQSISKIVNYKTYFR